MTNLLIPLDEAIVFPGVTATLPIDTGDEERVFLLPRQDGEFGRVGVVAEVVERAQLPNGGWAATVVGLHRGLAGAAQSGEGEELRVDVQEIHDGNPEDERSHELMREYRAVVEEVLESSGARTSASVLSCAPSRSPGRSRTRPRSVPISRASRS